MTKYMFDHSSFLDEPTVTKQYRLDFVFQKRCFSLFILEILKMARNERSEAKNAKFNIFETKLRLAHPFSAKNGWRAEPFTI